MKFAVSRFLAIALLWLAAAVPASAACYQWSKTAASNATADATINWAEGMAPSAVNDSARAMMARLAECRDDVSGSLTTGGTSTAYTLTTNQGLPNPPTTGQMISFTMNATNGASPTLVVDGGTAYALQSAPGVALASGTLALGSPYTATFSGSAWIMRDFYATQLAVPLGAMLPYTGSTAPNSNFVLPIGQCISRTVYATYFAMVSTTFGTCDGVSTFGVPDMRAQIPVALDNMGGSAANRLTSNANGCGTAFTALGVTCANGNESRTLTIAQIPSHNHTASQAAHSHTLANANLNALYGNLNVGFNGVAQGASVGAVSTDSQTPAVTVNNAGGGGAHATVMPVIGVYYILRVL